MVTYSLRTLTVLPEIAGEMQGITSNIQRIVTGLDDASAQHLAEWTSAARDAYNEAKAKWDAAMQDMIAQSANAQAALQAIGDNYIQAEQQGASLWNG